MQIVIIQLTISMIKQYKMAVEADQRTYDQAVNIVSKQRIDLFLFLIAYQEKNSMFYGIVRTEVVAS